MLAGDDGGGGERLEAALGDAEVGVPRQIHAGVHQRGDLGRRQPAARRGVEGLVQALDPGQALLGVLGARRLQRRLHCPRALGGSGGPATGRRALGFLGRGGDRRRGGERERPDLRGRGREGGGGVTERAHTARRTPDALGGWGL